MIQSRLHLIQRRTFTKPTPQSLNVMPSTCVKTPFSQTRLLFIFISFGRWSARTPIPSLGDDTTNYDDVVDFYDFWFSFSSWRDFSFEDEYDPDEAESR